NGKVGLSAGAGALWIKQANLPSIRPQYQFTPKLNPSVSINYRKKKVNVFFQGDYMLNNTLNKNEFVDRYYDNGLVIRQQTKRNRNTNIVTAKSGVDYFINDKNQWSTSILFSSEKILDNGDEPFFNQDLTERQRLWQFLEDELKTTFTASSTFQHKFVQPGRTLNFGYNYTFHRENEKYFFTNILPTYTGKDSFKLLSDEHVSDFTIDYVQPLIFGRIETGAKMRYRSIPTNMQFYPGLNSPIDSSAGGWATYKETIPAGYLTYILEKSNYEIEAGIRAEYVKVDYLVNPDHPTYKSNGYNYFQPFPNIRVGYKISDHDKLTAYFNRRVDRPNEVDIRIFPKYDDAEIVKVGNPGLSPQFSNLYELGYKRTWTNGFVFGSLYHKSSEGTISRIASVVNDSPIIYSIMQNIGKSYNSGLELVLNQKVQNKVTFNLNANAYKSTINAFSVVNLYPETNISTSAKQELYSWNTKFTTQIHLQNATDIQITAIYLAPDLIPQGKIGTRYSLDVGAKKDIQKGRGQVFINATDLLNTMNIKKQIVANGFSYTSTDFYETQVIRVGYNYKF
ncbi:MAG: outer membrane beta-barrel family protein, partial [Flavobacteriales bacterium]